MSPGVSRRTAIVAGAQGGIGRAVVTTLLSHGWFVLGADLAACAAGTDTAGSNFKYLSADVRREADVAALFDAARRDRGSVDAVVNATGVGVFKPIQELTVTDFQATVDVNLLGAFLCCREAIKAMDQTGGRIIHLGSIAGRTPLYGNGAYGATKAALTLMNSIVNEEGKDRRIRATIIHLGAVNTSIWASRKGFDKSLMLDPVQVSQVVLDILERPLSIRIDEIVMVPSQGIL